ncbi:MAG: hypothetical protein CMM01_16330 [Rhodopirellula sp.]|nr:hypothetical protein [Rhodopirellula sp.]
MPWVKLKEMHQGWGDMVPWDEKNRDATAVSTDFNRPVLTQSHEHWDWQQSPPLFFGPRGMPPEMIRRTGSPVSGCFVSFLSVTF